MTSFRKIEQMLPMVRITLSQTFYALSSHRVLHLSTKSGGKKKNWITTNQIPELDNGQKFDVSYKFRMIGQSQYEMFNSYCI